MSDQFESLYPDPALKRLRKVAIQGIPKSKKDAEAVHTVLEYIYQHSEGSCPLCHVEDYPVKGDKKGYDEVTAEEAKYWQIDHHDDCPVLVLERLRDSLHED